MSLLFAIWKWNSLTFSLQPKNFPSGLYLGTFLSEHSIFFFFVLAFRKGEKRERVKDWRFYLSENQVIFSCSIQSTESWSGDVQLTVFNRRRWRAVVDVLKNTGCEEFLLWIQTSEWSVVMMRLRDQCEEQPGPEDAQVSFDSVRRTGLWKWKSTLWLWGVGCEFCHRASEWTSVHRLKNRPVLWTLTGSCRRCRCSHSRKLASG